MELISPAVEAALAGLDAMACADGAEDYMTPTRIAEICVEAAQPFWNIQAESVALTARKLLEKILHEGPAWDPVESKKEVRDLAVALKAWESSRIAV